MCGDERKDIQRDAVDGNKGVPPLADIRQCCRNIPVELRDVVEGEAVGEISVACGGTPVGARDNNRLQRTTENARYASAPRSEQM